MLKTQEGATAGFLGVVFRCAVPGILLAVVCLVPYLDKAYTIDDPVFLLAAKQILRTPWHPFRYQLCWFADMRCAPAYSLGPGAALMGYALVPVILAGGAEWMTHALQILFAVAAVLAMVALVTRLGYGRIRAVLAGLILVATPPFLPMASTAFPDILALCCGLLGIERLFAWKAEGRWGQALAAGLALGLAPFARPHYALLTALGAFLLLDGMDLSGWLRQLRQTPLRWTPIAIAAMTLGAAIICTRDRSAGINPPHEFVNIRAVPKNLYAFITYLAFPLPFTIPWALLNWRKSKWLLAAAPFAASAGLAIRQLSVEFRPFTLSEWAHLSETFSLAAVGHMLWQAWKSHNHYRISLALWLLIPLSVLAYLHLPVKLLLISVPSIILVLCEASRRLAPRAAATSGLVIVMLGVIQSSAILRADYRFARLARSASRELIAPYIASGHQVWFAGQWGFYWYALEAGATPVNSEGHIPRPGDLLAVGNLEAGNEIRRQYPDRTLVMALSESCACGRTVGAGAGLYTNRSAFVLWSWGKGEINRYELWRVN